MYDLYNENHETLMKEIHRDLQNGNICLYVGELVLSE